MSRVHRGDIDLQKLTDEIKEKILGLNAARLYGIDVEAKKKQLSNAPVQIAAE